MPWRFLVLKSPKGEMQQFDFLIVKNTSNIAFTRSDVI